MTKKSDACEVKNRPSWYILFAHILQQCRQLTRVNSCKQLMKLCGVVRLYSSELYFRVYFWQNWVKLVYSVLDIVVHFNQLMFAVIFTTGIWFRIDIVYISGYGILYSFDWWALYVAIVAQVSFVTQIYFRTCTFPS